MPTPRPDTSVTLGAVLRPGRKTRRQASAYDITPAASGDTNPFSTAFRFKASAFSPRPSSSTSIHTCPASLLARSNSRPELDFPALRPLLRPLQSVIQGVPHQVYERVADLLQDRLVQLHA